MITLQECLFERALLEEGIEKDRIKINHGTPLNYNGDKEYNFVFPKSFSLSENGFNLVNSEYFFDPKS